MIYEPPALDRAQPCLAAARIAIMLGTILLGTTLFGSAPAVADGWAYSGPAASRVPCTGPPLNGSYRMDSRRLGDRDLPGQPRLGALRAYPLTESTDPWPTPDPPLSASPGVGVPPGDGGGRPEAPRAVDPGWPGPAESPPAAGRESAASGDRAEPAGQATAQQDAPQADLASPLTSPLGWTEADKRSLIYSGVLALALATVGLAMVGWRRRQW
jgi:hypothetical protein